MNRLPRLILLPEDPDAVPLQEANWLDGLHQIGLLGPPLNGLGHAWTAGKEFLSLVCFLGCSPQVILAQEEAGTAPEDMGCSGLVVHIEIPSTRDVPEWLGDPQARPPRCPDCNILDRKWRASTDAVGLWHCPSCGAHYPPAYLHWGKGAGGARIRIEIHGVFPSEAVPEPELLEWLAQQTGGPWRYFYLSAM